MARENENQPLPLSAPGASEAIVSATQTSRICCKLVVNVTTALTTFAIRTLDGTAAALGALPVGVWTFDVQFDMVTWTGGAATVVGFARI